MDEVRGISKLDLKRRNRKQILLSIREAGQLARVDIAKRLALTRAAVTIITNTMVSQGILIEVAQKAAADNEPRTRGRKKTMICINPNYKFVFGVAITERQLSIGLANLGGDVMDKAYMDIDDDTELQAITSFLAKNIKSMLKNSSLERKQILGLGIGIMPSRVALLRGEEKKTGWEFARVKNMLELELEMPVHINNLIGLYALANIDYPSQRYMTQVVLYSGDQYHASIIANNEMVSGMGRDTDVINSYIVTPNGEACDGYPNGSVYAELSKPALIRRAAAILKADPAELTFDRISEAYKKGDKKIVALLNDAAEKLALMVYNVAIANGAERVVLQSFALIPETEQVLRETLAKLIGPGKRTLALDLSKLTPDHSFVAGSNWCVEQQFIDLGGMTRFETSNGSMIYGYNPEDKIYHN